MIVLKKITTKKISNIFENITANALNSRQAKWLFGLLDLALLVAAFFLIFGETEYTYYLVPLIFLLLTFGAFFWEFRIFALRAGFWTTITIVTELVRVLTGESHTEEVVEVFFLTVLLILVFIIAGQRKRAEEALRVVNQDLENRVVERTAALTKLNNELVLEIAERVQMAEQLRILSKDLENLLEHEQAMRNQLVQAEKLTAMGRMVVSIAHELNNPLQIIKNCLFLTQQEIAPDGPVYEYLDMSASEIERLSNLVAQLREVYRPDPTDTMQPLELLKVLEETHFLLSPHLQQQRVRWEQKSGPNDFIVQGIADQLKQVFLNISLNAIEAMQPTGGTLLVDLVVAAGPNRVGVVLQDTGPGISPENISELFEPFFTTKKAGTGLGLSISYDIVRTHGGQIAVDSRPGKGTIFTVWLPLVTMEE